MKLLLTLMADLCKNPQLFFYKQLKLFSIFNRDIHNSNLLTFNYRIIKKIEKIVIVA